jgi:hypothetical protein
LAAAGGMDGLSDSDAESEMDAFLRAAPAPEQSRLSADLARKVVVSFLQYQCYAR